MKNTNVFNKQVKNFEVATGYPHQAIPYSPTVRAAWEEFVHSSQESGTKWEEIVSSQNEFERYNKFKELNLTEFPKTREEYEFEIKNDCLITSKRVQKENKGEMYTIIDVEVYNSKVITSDKVDISRGLNANSINVHYNTVGFAADVFPTAPHDYTVILFEKNAVNKVIAYLEEHYAPIGNQRNAEIIESLKRRDFVTHECNNGHPLPFYVTPWGTLAYISRYYPGVNPKEILQYNISKVKDPCDSSFSADAISMDSGCL